MIFCSEEIKAGEMKRIWIPVEGGEPIEAFFISGGKGKTLAVTAGVHGCEYASIVAARNLVTMLDPAELNGNVIILPLINREGFLSGCRQIIPEDGQNLNRVFPGHDCNLLSHRIAMSIERYLYPVCDFLVDLHGGDSSEAMHPLVFFPVDGEMETITQARDAAEYLTVDYRVRSTAKNGLYSWAVQKGIPAILIERGGQGIWKEEDVTGFINDIKQLMGHLGILGNACKNPKQKEIVRVDYMEADNDGFWYPAVSPNDRIQKDGIIGWMEDRYGNNRKGIKARFSGTVLYHTTWLGVRKGDFLAAYGSEV